jgi:protein-tyrosine phosphatase
VPRETVMHDYLLTNRYSQDATSRTLLLLRVFSGFRTAPDDARPLFEARSEYLRAAFDAIDAHYGDTDRYLREGLGLDEPTLARLRENLLEP